MTTTTTTIPLIIAKKIGTNNTNNDSDVNNKKKETRKSYKDKRTPGDAKAGDRTPRSHIISPYADFPIY